MKRYSTDVTDTPAASNGSSNPGRPANRSPPCQPPPWMKKSNGAGASAFARGLFQKWSLCLGCGPYAKSSIVGVPPICRQKAALNGFSAGPSRSSLTRSPCTLRHHVS